MPSNKLPVLKAAISALALSFAAIGSAHAGATIVITNANAPGEGFNDTTPAAPIGGNSGTTLGQQRLIAFTYAANIWGATLNSAVPIVISAQMTPLPCDANTATLGSAGTTAAYRNFPGAPRTNTLYPFALTNKLYGGYANTPNTPQIAANFNSDLGKPGCFAGSYFYLGLDANHGTNVDFVTVLLHEMGHGLGFATFTNGITGAFGAGSPSAWDYYLLDNTTNKSWATMTAAERAASALKPSGLSWTGPNVSAAVAGVLTTAGQVAISGVNAGPAARTYTYGDASFGPPLKEPAVIGQVMPVVDQADGTGLACTALSATNALAVKNNIALVSRGTCPFVQKSKMLQNAGAIGVIIADNAGDPFGMSGTDASITIPSVMISKNDGIALKARLVTRTRTSSGVIARLGLATSGPLAGADSSGRITMYTPAAFVQGSSVSHFNTTAFRNQLMEPNINSDLTHSPKLPQDLTYELLKDIGW